MRDTTGAMLQGLRVLDFTQGIAGPACTRILAGLGADVVKVESPHGDPCRLVDPLGLPAREPSELFAYLNGGKAGLTLDLLDPRDDHAVDSLMRGADVIVESFAEDVATRLNVTPARARQAGSSAVFCSLRNFGNESAYRDFAVDHLLLLALSGYLHQIGLEGRPPLALGQDIGLHACGVMAAAEILAAVHAVGEEGGPVTLELPLVHMLNWLQPGTLAHLAIRGDHAWPRRTNSGAGVVRVKDGWVGANTLTRDQWERLMAVAGRPDFVDREDWRADVAKFLADTPEWAAPVVEWAAGLTVSDIIELTQSLRIPFAKVVEVPDLLEIEQYRARDAFAVQTIEGRPVSVPGAPFLSTEQAWVQPGDVLPELSVKEAPVNWSPRLRPRASSAPALPLAGLRVLELGAWWSAAACTSMLGGLGADVIKIEPPRMDAWRLTAVPANPDRVWERGPIFDTFNLNKRGLVLDIASAKGKELFLRLVETADVVVENFSPRVMPNLGLDYQQLKARRPGIVLASISGYGATGPMRDFVAFGAVFEQSSGVAGVMGYREDDVPRGINAYSDAMVGMWTSTAILAALEHRRRTGRGQWLDVSAVQCLSTFLGGQLAAWQLRGVAPRRLGNRVPGAAPHEVFPCRGADSWVAIAVLDDSQWQSLVAAMGSPEWAADVSFQTLAGRKAREDDIEAGVGRWTASRPHREVMALLQAVRVPCGIVLAPDEQEADPGFAGAGHFVRLDRPVVGVVPYPRVPGLWNGRQLDPTHPAPLFNQHGREILMGELGVSDDELAALYADGVTCDLPVGYA